jgi:hypothetical protein
LTEAASFVRQNAPNDRSLIAAIGRLDFTWQRAQAKLVAAAGGFNPVNPNQPIQGPQQNYLVSLARALDRQSDLLVTVGQQSLPNDVWGTTLERSIRNFAAAVDQLRTSFETGQAIVGPLSNVKAEWEALARTLGGLQLNQFAAVRQQASRVNQLYITLLQAIGQQQVPAPVFAINNQKQRGVFAVGAGEGGVPVVRVYSDSQGGQFNDFLAYDPSFQGGVRVAVGDINGDGVADIVTGPGQGMQPIVRVFDGRDLSLMNQFLAYDQRFLSGVFVAAADVTGDGRAEIVCGAGDPGGPHVRAFDGMTGQVKAQFFAYDQNLQCGARVALGDIDGDGIPDIVTAPGAGVEPLVKVFSGRNLALLSSFHAYEPAFHGGVFVAAADVTRGRRAQVISGPGTNGGPHVRIFDPLTQRVVHEFFAYDRSFRGGVRPAVFNALGGAGPDIITAPGPGIPPVVRIFRNRDGQLEREFSAFDPNFRGGAWVAGN